MRWERISRSSEKARVSLIRSADIKLVLIQKDSLAKTPNGVNRDIMIYGYLDKIAIQHILVRLLMPTGKQNLKGVPCAVHPVADVTGTEIFFLTVL